MCGGGGGEGLQRENPLKKIKAECLPFLSPLLAFFLSSCLPLENNCPKFVCLFVLVPGGNIKVVLLVFYLFAKTHTMIKLRRKNIK